jgi:4-hydroxybenzoate polyprenyltransferase
MLAPGKVLRKTRKTGAVSSAPPKGPATCFVPWRRAAAPFALLKAEKWWNDKAPPVLGLAYYLLATDARPVPLGRALMAMLAFIIAFIGVAGFGHVINDLGDLEVDRAAGKRNTMQGRTRLQIGLIIVALLAMAWLPWLVLPANRWNLTFIGVQLLLLTLYAAPPLRLKTRAIPAVLTDALYAYTVPMLITWTTWRGMGGVAKPQALLLAALLPWSLCAGIKGILVHQDGDAANDAACGVGTFVTRYGHESTFWLLSRMVIPSEIACFAMMTLAVSRELRFYLPVVVLLFCWRTFQLAWLRHVPVGLPWRMSSEDAVALYGFLFAGNFYRAWFPVVMLAALCFRDPLYLGLGGMHLALFKTGLDRSLRKDLRHVAGEILRMRRLA